MTMANRKPVCLPRSCACGLLAALILPAASGTARGGLILASNLTSPPSYSRYAAGIGYAGSSIFGPFSNETPAQEFTAAASGEIGTITATVVPLQPEVIPLTVNVAVASGSVPGAVLGSRTFASRELSSEFDVPSTFHFSSAGIHLTAGQRYFVWFSVATPANDSLRYMARLLNTPNPIGFGFQYIESPDGGSTWITNTPIPNEIGLTITAVPEPSPIVLAGLGGLLLIGCRWRRGRRAVAVAGR